MHNEMQAALAALKEKLLGEYEVRKTQAQKSAFIDWACAYARECGMEMTVEESGKLVRTRSLVAGDPDTAKILITAHYDTCARMPFPNFMTPMNWPLIILTQLALPILVFGVLGGCAGYLMGMLFSHFDLSPFASFLLTETVWLGFVGAVVYLMLSGPANPHTANDNTSGTALVLLAMRLLGARDDVAYVLFDNEEKGLLGSSAFSKRHPSAKKNALVINYDCISDGQTLLYACAKKAARHKMVRAMNEAMARLAPKYGRQAKSAVSPKVFYPSDQMNFVHGTAFAALKGKRVLYLDRIHTQNDTVFDDANLLLLMESLQETLGGAEK